MGPATTTGARARRAVALLAGALVLAACGGDGQEAATTASGPATSVAAPAVTSGGPPGADGEPAIVVETPAAGAAVESPVTVAGTADVFEATVTVVVRDRGGNELARDFTTATCGTGCRGEYSIELPFSVEEEQPGTIVVQDEDASGAGAPPHVAELPVVLVAS